MDDSRAVNGIVVELSTCIALATHKEICSIIQAKETKGPVYAARCSQTKSAKLDRFRENAWKSLSEIY